MDVYTEHENFAILRVLFHYESILLSNPTTVRLLRLDFFLADLYYQFSPLHMLATG